MALYGTDHLVSTVKLMRQSQKGLLPKGIFFGYGQYIIGPLRGKSPIRLNKANQFRNYFLQTDHKHTAKSGQGDRTISGHLIPMKSN